MRNRSNKITTRFITFVVLSLLISFSSSAHDSERIIHLEKDLENAIKRIETLESMLRNNNEATDRTTRTDGWKSIENWRKLSTGMNSSTVREILGEPEKINGGNYSMWQYSNRGRVNFIDDELYSWSEPI